MVSIGERGLPRGGAADLETAAASGEGIDGIDGLRVLGNPRFASRSPRVRELDIYRVMDAMTARRWSLNGLHRPPAVHICVTLRHAQPGVAERFVEDLRASVDQVRRDPAGEGGMAPVYGMAATMPVRAAVGAMLKNFVDMWLRP